jgi:hypothetical protein
MTKKDKQVQARRKSASSARDSIRDSLDAAQPFGWKNRADWLQLGIVVGVALALRLAFFFLNKAFNPTFYFPVMDSLYHHEWALDIVAGGTPGTDVFFRGPCTSGRAVQAQRIGIAFAVGGSPTGDVDGGHGLPHRA